MNEDQPKPKNIHENRALAHLASASDVLSNLKGKKLQKMAEKASRTGRLDLERKRMKLQEQAIFVSEIATMLSVKSTEPWPNLEEAPDDATRKVWARQVQDRQEFMNNWLNMANLAGMAGYLEGLGLIVDCVTEVEECKVRQKDGTVEPGKRRISVAENLTEIHDFFVDQLKLAEAQLQMTHDLLARSVGFGQDEHGVEEEKSPYEGKETEEKEAVPEVAEGEGGVVMDKEEEEMLRRAKERVSGKPRSGDQDIPHGVPPEAVKSEAQ